jgi:hypothetical protein
MVPHYADGSTAVHPPDQCVHQERREPCRSRGALLHVLQLGPRASDASRGPSDGSGHLFRTLWSILEIVAQLDAADKKNCTAEALTMFVGWVGVIVFTAAMVAGLRANHLADRIIEEVHARMEPKDRVPSYRVWNWQWYGFLDQHKRLYPASDLRSRTYRWTAASFGLLLVAVFCFQLSVKAG